MAYPKGAKRPAGAGRKKGTPNRNTLDAQAKAEALGIDPFEVLLLIANGDWEALGYESPTKTLMSMGQPYEVDVIALADRRAAASDAAQFLLPKRKAADVTLLDERGKELAKQAEEFEKLPASQKIKLLEQHTKRLKGEK